jgi:lysylphosphatidylglycerol synthetase-like protein (DUF2156 family)
MKTAAIIILIFAVGNLLFSLLQVFFHELAFSQVLISLFSGFLGILLLFISYGILKRDSRAWHAGFVAIILAGIYFLLEVLFSLPDIPTSERITVILFSFFCAVAVCLFFIRIWQRQKNWFEKENKGSHLTI